jgi:hypothetical protein
MQEFPAGTHPQHQRRSPESGDARNDLRLATGAMPGNWMRWTGTMPAPHLLTTGFVVTIVARLGFTDCGDLAVPIILSGQAVFEWRHLSRRCR